MLKYLGTAVTFTEFPDEIALCINITGCPCKCMKCSEPEMQADVGEELNSTKISELIEQNPGITCIGFLGGDSSHEEIRNLTNFVHEHFPGLKVGMYSGLDFRDPILDDCLDFYKIGRWIMFSGPVSTWKTQIAGPLCLPTSNQKYYEKIDGTWVDSTDKFRRKVINDWKTVII